MERGRASKLSKLSISSWIMVNSLRDWTHTPTARTCSVPTENVPTKGWNRRSSLRPLVELLGSFRKPRDPHVWCVWPCHLAWFNVSTMSLIPLIKAQWLSTVVSGLDGEAVSFWMPVWSAWTELSNWKRYCCWTLALAVDTGDKM